MRGRCLGFQKACKHGVHDQDPLPALEQSSSINTFLKALSSASAVKVEMPPCHRKVPNPFQEVSSAQGACLQPQLLWKLLRNPAATGSDRAGTNYQMLLLKAFKISWSWSR